MSATAGQLRAVVLQSEAAAGFRPCRRAICPKLVTLAPRSR